MNTRRLKVISFIVCTLLVGSAVLPTYSNSNIVYAEASATNQAQEIVSEVIEESHPESELEQESTQTPPQVTEPTQVGSSAASQVIVLTRNSKNYSFNGVNKTLTQPVTEKDGVTYIPLKSIAELYGFNVSYNSKTKESTASNNQLSLAFKLNSTQVKVDNSTVKTIPKTLTISGSLMVPLRAWTELTNSTLTLTDTEIKIEWKVGPSAKFKVVASTPIFANQTEVKYEDLSSSPTGAKIVEEKWSGHEAIFKTAGKHTITRQVKDEFGVWSTPYSVTIEVLKENLPPVANFSTNKTTYKLGEPIIYTDLSTDDYKIKSVTWSNNEPVFFTAGDKKVSIVVEDIYGLKSTFEKSIVVSDEVMYTEKEYYYNFTRQGQKLNVPHSLALQADNIPYVITPVESSTVVRLNSPEQLSQAGIDYKDTIDAGQIRFAIHKENKTAQSFQINLIATNHNDFPVYITNDGFAMGGPAIYVNQAGKASVTRFLENIAKPKQTEAIEILPGQSIQILPKEGLVEIAQGRTVSIFADYTTTGPLEFTNVITKFGDDALSQLSTLEQTPHDNKHVRGTFSQADRRLVFTYNFGTYPTERILIGDSATDKSIDGIDAITGNPIKNAGNGAVKYSFSVDVKPNTLVMFNGRGGLYAGAILINGKVVGIADEGFLNSSTEAVVLYRTGDEKEKVNFTFIPAPGSNLPISIIFDQVPVIEVEDIHQSKVNITNPNPTQDTITNTDSSTN